MADPAAAVNQGIAGYNAMAAGLRARDAANALVNAYGPQAADPDMWAKAMGANALQQELPSEVQLRQAQASQAQQMVAPNVQEAQSKADIGKSQAYANNVLAAVNSLQASMDPQTQQLHPNVVESVVGDGSNFGLSPQVAAAWKTRLSSPNGSQLLPILERGAIAQGGHASMLGMAGAPHFGVGPNDQPMAIIADKMGGIQQVPLGGTAPTQVMTAQTGQGSLAERQRHNAVAEDIARMNAGRQAQNSTYGTDYTAPVLGGAASGSAASAGGSAPAAPARFYTLPPKGRAMAIDAAQKIGQMQTYVQNGDYLANLMKQQIGPYTTGPGSLLAHLPGTSATNLKRNAETLKSIAGQLAIQGMKNTQGQGAGRIMQKEYQNFLSLYGNLDEDQTGAQYLKHLNLALDSFHRLQSIASDSYKQMWGVTPSVAMHGIPQAAIQHLMANPKTADQFDAYYGNGSAAQYLGKH